MTYQLIREHISRDTIEALTGLLQLAQTGAVTGVAIAVMMRRRKYLVDVCGEAYRDPTFARGAVAALDDELRDIVRSQAHTGTTL